MFLEPIRDMDYARKEKNSFFWMCFSRADHKNLLPCLFLDSASLDSVSMRTGTSGQTLQKVLYKCNTYLSITLIAEMRYVKYIKSERKTDSEGLPSSREKLSLHNKVIIFGHQYNYSSHTSRADLWDPKLAIHCLLRRLVFQSYAG